MREVYYSDALVTLYQGEALDVLRSLESDSAGLVLTDPPYSSGGIFRGDRMASPGVKYQSSNAARRFSDFAGDTRDQRSYGYWCALWLSECLRIAEPGALCLVFTDWRQLPTTTDALQAGGWVWRGIVTWHKRTGRPRRGGFRSEAEFVAWGSRGAMRDDHEVYLPGVVTTSIARDSERQHLAAKPLSLLTTLVEAAPPGGLVLDPFCGSGTTLVAAKRCGRRAVGIEIDEACCEVGAARLAQGSIFEHDLIEDDDSSMMGAPWPL